MANPFRICYIVLPDGAEVLTNQLLYPQGRLMSPSTASATYGAAIVPVPGSGVRPPYNFSPRIGYQQTDNSILAITADSATFAANFTVDAEGVLYPLSGSAGGTIEWRAFYFTEVPNTGLDGESLQTRHWACGFEIPTLGEGNTSGGTHYSRDASRTVEGTGFAFRSLFNEAQTFSLPTSSASSWERLYIRLRKLPVGGNEYFWYLKGTVEGGAALVMGVTTTGALVIYNKGNQAFPGTLVATIPPFVLNTWTRLDLLINFATATVPNGLLKAYVNGALAQNVSTIAGGAGGLQTVQLHTGSSIGNQGSIASNGGELDVDDWSNYSQPALFTGIDWLHGSHIRRVLPTSFGATHSVNWTGDVHILAGIPVAGQSASDFLATASTAVPIDVITDYEDRYLGCAAFTVGWYSVSGGGAGASLGWVINGTQDIATQIVGAGVWATRLYSAAGTVPPAIAPLVSDVKVPLRLIYIKNAAGTEHVQALQATAEYLGSWGPEDDINQVFPPRQGVHNSPYFDQSTSNSFSTPTSPVSVTSGTYVGNNTGQEISLGTQPIHWLWIRALTGSTSTTVWYSSQLAGHDYTNRLPTVNRVIRLLRASTLPDAVYNLHLSGADVNSNANGVTYQWVGFSDAGMRYNLNGAGAHLPANDGDINLLKDSGFTPESVFLVPEALSSTSTKHFYRGPGHTATTASPLSATQVTLVDSFAAGSLTTKANTSNTDIPQFAYSAWRTTDGTGTGPVAITSYTGDGTGNRNIALVLGGRFPHFALIVPHTGVSYFRDPSHTTTTSQTVAGTADASTGIRAGAVNQITVGSALNTGATVYDVFVLAGDATGAGSGGWSSNPATPSNPIFTVPTIVPSGPGAWAPTDTKGWWMSVNKFTGSANLITTPQNPKHPRHWDKVVAFATGNAAMLGGSPGAGVTYNNHLIYAGDDYTVGTDSPTIHIFDGTSDRLMAAASPVDVTPAKAVMSMIIVGSTVYFTTLDSGSSAADFAGRVLALDINSQNVTQVGTAGFGSGEVPYALVWHMGRLWCGTNKSNGTGGKVYYFRPGIDTAWTTDFTLATLTAGSVCSMASYLGKLYVGCDAAIAVFAQVIVRDSLGAWTSTHTASGGTARLNNGFLSLQVFGTNLYAGWWNPTPSLVALVKKFDGTTWSTAYTGTGTSVNAYIGMFVSDNQLFIVGGGNATAASLLNTVDGAVWTNETAYLSGPTTETAVPIFGVVGL